MLIQVKQDKTNLPKKLHQGLPKSGLQHSNDKRDCGWHHHDPHVVYQQFFPAFLAVLLPHEDISLLRFTGLCGTLFFHSTLQKWQTRIDALLKFVNALHIFHCLGCPIRAYNGPCHWMLLFPSMGSKHACTSTNATWQRLSVSQNSNFPLLPSCVLHTLHDINMGLKGKAPEKKNLHMFLHS